ncbi:hypothetical protein FBUS_03641 [Fasciolopsis buskii]|uniref:G-protein coupled receptors family 1 profile domain-containing protein n=1 Tax=Fasciolopsis buskii TaxID=27845 RepID=A0A8E0RY59_9TREM|nr:hypothetical protein FBUS_03641 [Fasciolopsis buski]
MNSTNNTAVPIIVGDIAAEYNLLQPLNTDGKVGLWKLIPLSALISWTLVSNGLLTCAIIRKPTLRTQSNLLVGHQAAIDFVIGLFFMTVAAAKDVLGYTPLSIEWTVIWLYGRRLTFTASVWSTTSIAIDRCVAIAYPQWYLLGIKQKIKRTVIYCSSIWIVSFTAWFPSVLKASEKVRFLYEVKKQSKSVTIIFTSDPFHTIYAVCGTLLIPLVLMIVLYGRMLLLMRKQRRKIENAKPPSTEIHTLSRLRRSSSMQIHNSFAGFSPSTRSGIDLSKGCQHQVHSMIIPMGVFKEHASAEVPKRIPSPCPFSQMYDLCDRQNRCRIINHPSTPVLPLPGTPIKMDYTTISHQLDKRMIREQRATRLVVMLITLQLFACLPYSMFYLSSLFSGRLNNSSTGQPGGFLQRLLIWDSYINSALNPIAYAVFNRGLRKAFFLFGTPRQCRPPCSCTRS